MMLSFSEMQMIEDARESVDEKLIKDYYGDDSELRVDEEAN